MFFRELKDNLGSDEPEGDAPVLLQAMLARNPGIFREKSTNNFTCHWYNNHYIENYKKKFFFFVSILNRCHAAANGTTI